jgi:transcription elongation factor Elf1
MEDQCPICGSQFTLLAKVDDGNVDEYFYECKDCGTEMRMVVI